MQVTFRFRSFNPVYSDFNDAGIQFDAFPVQETYSGNRYIWKRPFFITDDLMDKFAEAGVCASNFDKMCVTVWSKPHWIFPQRRWGFRHTFMSIKPIERKTLKRLNQVSYDIDKGIRESVYI